MTGNITGVYVIYTADVISPSAHFIGCMAPEHHIPAGHNGDARIERERIAAKFSQAEGNEQYDFGYLAEEHGERQYLPYEPDSDNDQGGQGQHRTWVAELSFAEWVTVAGSYCIGLDESGIPERYDLTLGSITEYGTIPAISVDVSEGWQDSRTEGEVLYAAMCVSFAMEGP